MDYFDITTLDGQNLWVSGPSEKWSVQGTFARVGVNHDPVDLDRGQAEDLCAFLTALLAADVADVADEPQAQP